MLALCPRSEILTIYAFENEYVSLKDLLNWHGLNLVFGTPDHRFSPYLSPPIAARLIYATTLGALSPEDEDRREFEQAQNGLRSLGDYMLSMKPPWFTPSKSRYYPIEFALEIREARHKLTLPRFSGHKQCPIN